MSRFKPDPNTWWAETSENCTLRIRVEKDEKGYWGVYMMDWPRTSRSEMSEAAEAKIRAAVKLPDKP